MPGPVKTTTFAGVLLTFTLTAISAISCAQPAPGTITDDQGRRVYLESEPMRIVSHVPAITETLFALGQEDRIVGVSDYCDYPEEAAEKPKVGGYFTPPPADA